MSSLPVYENGLVLSGYQRKLKTMRKKYFVLYKETSSSTARLEYFDNEKKFKSGSPPKRVIKLKNCFNINRRLDTKYNFVISLSSREGAFGIVLESEDDMKRWLDMLISLQRSNYNVSDNGTSTEHMWHVVIQKRGLAEEKGLSGNYFVRLTCKTVLFMKAGLDPTPANESKIISSIEFFLTTIRRCGDSQCYFYMEVGRQSIIGPGEIWMKTEDSSIAQSMHRTILSAMSIKTEMFAEPMRKRSSSANEASKPINVIQRKHTHQENKCNNSPQPNANFLRERSDSLPSKKRSVGDGINPVISASTVSRNNSSTGKHPFPHPRCSSSPPTNSNFACSESEESSISLDETEENGSTLTYRFIARSSDGIILEENNEDFHCPDNPIENADKNDNNGYSMKLSNPIQENYLSMAPLKSSNNAMIEQSINNISNEVTDSSIVFLSELVAENGTIGQCELPTRAYSVGSKVEHNRMKRVGSVYECEHRGTRIRAFSVGSRSKLCRNDPQREHNSIIQHNCNSNNNIIYKNDAACGNPLSYANINRGIKSTSAPLLHKSHTSVERMGDLMEIDFSKKIPHSNRNSHTTDLSRFEHSPRNTVLLQQNFMKSSVKKETSVKFPQVSLNTDSASENGYLEMKPVGEISNFKSNSVHYSMNCTLNDIIEPKVLEGHLNVDQNRTPLLEGKKINKNKIDSNLQKESDIDFKNTYSTYNSEKNKNQTNLSIPQKTKFDVQSNLIKLTVTQISNIKLNNCTSQLFRTNRDSPNQKENAERNDTEFKSDNILSQSTSNNECKSLKSPISDYELLDRKSNKSQCQTTTQKLQTTNKSNKSVSANSLTSECNCTENDVIHKLENDLHIKNNSRPSSTSSEYKLYYASLDLPQCSSQTNMKVIKLEPNSSPPINGCNEYAKIDFDHSDSSSSSSKNFS